MNQVHVEWTENKSQDWKVITVTDPKHGKVENVSVNRTNKEGKVFPNFDGITPGADVPGDLWKSQAGKWYLFEAKTQGFTNSGKGGQMTKVMEKKAENIEKAQDRKEESISKSGAQRDAVLLVTTFFKLETDFTNVSPDQQIKTEIEKWYKYFLNLQDQPFV